MRERKRIKYTNRGSLHSDELRRYLCIPSNISADFLGIPEDLKSCVRSYLQHYQQENMLKAEYPAIFEELNPKNYLSRMDTLVFLEEIYKKEECSNLSDHLKPVYVYYDEADALYHLDDVIDLLLHKQRPGVAIGGKLELKDKVGDYNGIIMSIKSDGIGFDLPQDTIHDGMYCVSLIHSETNMKKQLLSLRRVIRSFGYFFLFPKIKEIREFQFQRKILHWFNPSLNTPQKNAVEQILRGSCRPMPYVVLGPPGTGKTITLVEAVCQVASLIDYSVIIVATSSNRCANNIAQKLKTMKLEDRFLRLASINYFERDLIPNDIKNITISSQYATPEMIKKYKIIVSTCSTIGSFMFKDLPSNYFTHVFVDEAGQVTEPDLLIPISLLYRPRAQIVLFGDPLQIGPSVFAIHCKSAKEDRLDCSFLQRLMEFEPYWEDESHYDSDLVTKLVYNYR